MSTPEEILSRHVKLFNDGVRYGSFGPMMSHFAEDAEMYFEGIPVGPFKGRAAIERSYSSQPPDDEIVILNVRKGPTENVIIGEYAWSKNPNARAGELRVTVRKGLIMKISVLYER